MSCRRPTTKNSIRKSKSCCNSRYDSDSTSDSSFDSSDSSSCTSSDSSCGCFDCDCYDCDNSPPKRRKGKGKAKKRIMLSKKTSKPCKSPCSAKISKKKTDRRTKGRSCGCSKGDCSDMCSSDGEYGDCYDCGPPKRRQKGKCVPKRPRQRQRSTAGHGLGRTSNDQKND